MSATKSGKKAARASRKPAEATYVPQLVRRTFPMPEGWRRDATVNYLGPKRPVPAPLANARKAPK